MRHKFSIGIIACVLLCIVVLSPIHARSISAVGYGKTFEEAERKAYTALQGDVFGTYQFVQSQSATSLSNTNLEYDYSSQVSVKNEGTFIGFEYNTIPCSTPSDLMRGQYRSVISIDESTLPSYMWQIEQLAKTINSVYAHNTTSHEAEKAKLVGLMSDLQLYEGYIQVAIKLGADSDTLEEFSVPVTRSTIHQYLLNILVEEESSLIDATRNEKDIISLANLNKELDSNRSEQELLKDQQAQSRQIAESMAMINLEERVNSILNNDFIESNNKGLHRNDYSVSAMINNIKTSQLSWNSLYSEYSFLLNQEILRIDRNLSSEIEALQNKVYKITELKNGVPTEEAKQYRNLEIENLIEISNAEKNELLDLIKSSLQPRLQEKYDSLILAINELNNFEFKATEKDGEIFINIGEFDPRTASWPVEISIKTNGGLFDMKLGNWFIEYKSISGEAPAEFPKSLSDKLAVEAYEKYSENVEFYNRVLNSFEDSNYDIVARYSVKYEDNSNSFIFNIIDICLTNEGKVEQEFKLVRSISSTKKNDIIPESKPDWIGNIVEDTKKREKQELQQQKIQVLLNRFNVDLSAGYHYADYGRFELVDWMASARVPVSFDIFDWMHIGVVSEYNYSQIMQSFGVLGEIEFHLPKSWNTIFDASLGLNVGFSNVSSTYRAYIGLGISKVSINAEYELIHSNNSLDLKSFGISVRIRDIL